MAVRGGGIARLQAESRRGRGSAVESEAVRRIRLFVLVGVTNSLIIEMWQTK